MVEVVTSNMHMGAILSQWFKGKFKLHLVSFFSKAITSWAKLWCRDREILYLQSGYYLKSGVTSYSGSVFISFDYFNPKKNNNKYPKTAKQISTGKPSGHYSFIRLQFTLTCSQRSKNGKVDLVSPLHLYFPSGSISWDIDQEALPQPIPSSSPASQHFLLAVLWKWLITWHLLHQPQATLEIMDPNTSWELKIGDKHDPPFLLILACLSPSQCPQNITSW